MIAPAYAQTMAAYDGELNRRLYAAAARLSDAARRSDGGAFFGSIHATLSHLLWADRMWMSRLAGWPRPAETLATSTAMAGDFAELRAAREAADAGIADWAAALSQHWIDGGLTWHSGALGRDMTMPRATIVMHLFNHQTHHRGQVHALLTRAGERTGDTDLFAVLPQPG